MKPSSDNTILQELRSSTRALHDVVDKSSGAGKIIDHTISEKELNQLLIKNYFAYSLADNMIADYQDDVVLKPIYATPRISKWIENDLKNRFVEIPEIKKSVKFNNVFEAIGAVYVTEGSMLGGQMISKQLLKCEDISNTEEIIFYATDKTRIDRWKNFKSFMNATDFSETEKESIFKGANKTFQLFIDAFDKVF
ncbi:biliverdin-producing heme oxygenase [Polaribacter sp.]|nr:biliverdin-producing heme oxygenase [Polaribacter sp.]